MLAVPQAQALVLDHARPLPPEPTPLTAAALGLVLAEDVVSDLDMPPYDKALMDGYAVRAADPVVMVERTERLAGDRVRIEDRPPQPGQNLLRRASEMRAGETVLSAGT